MIKEIFSLLWIFTFPAIVFYQAFFDKNSFYHKKLSLKQKEELDHYKSTFEKDPTIFCVFIILCSLMSSESLGFNDSSKIFHFFCFVELAVLEIVYTSIAVKLPLAIYRSFNLKNFLKYISLISRFFTWVSFVLVFDLPLIFVPLVMLVYPFFYWFELKNMYLKIKEVS